MTNIGCHQWPSVRTVYGWWLLLCSLLKAFISSFGEVVLVALRPCMAAAVAERRLLSSLSLLESCGRFFERLKGGGWMAEDGLSDLPLDSEPWLGFEGTSQAQDRV